VRVRPSHNTQPHDEQWLLIEWPQGDTQPRHYWFSTLPAGTPTKTLVSTAQGRWRIERDYQELKSEFGLHHYEGRNWRGFHHHASLCIAAYGFLMSERLGGVKKNRMQLQTPAVPEGFKPRGAGSDAASRD
jgi:SRSO17 transposase